jgi:hypothetical protein
VKKEISNQSKEVQIKIVSKLIKILITQIYNNKKNKK